MKTWSQFYDFVLPELPGVDTPLVDIFLRNTAIDFCEETWSLMADMDTISTVAAVYEYDLDSPESGVEVFAIKKAWIDSAPIDPISMDDLWAASTDWKTSSGKPSYFAQQEAFKVLLYAVPDAVYSLDLTATLRPTTTALGVPDRFFADYRRQVSWGTMAALMAQPAKPWSNPDRSAYYRKEYEAALTKSTVLTNRARSRAALQVTFRNF